MSMDFTPPSSPIFTHAVDSSDLDTQYAAHETEQKTTERADDILFEKENNLPFFNCLRNIFDNSNNVQNISDTSSEGFLQKGKLVPFYENVASQYRESNYETSVKVFDQQFYAHFYETTEVDKLFYTARFYINNLSEKLSTKELLSIRFELRKFIEFVNAVLYFNLEDKIILSCFFTHIHGLFTIARDMNMRSGLHLDKSESLHHRAHACLEIYWGVLEMLHNLSITYPDVCFSLKFCEGIETLEEGDVFYQCATVLLWDLIDLFNKTFNTVSEKELLQKSPFPCACVPEFLVMMIHLLHVRQLKMSKPSFLVTLYPILKTILDSEDNGSHTKSALYKSSQVLLLPPHIDFREKVIFVWWILKNIAYLFNYDRWGIFQQAGSVVPTNLKNCPILKELITATLKIAAEDKSRFSFKCLISLSAYWEIEPNIVSQIWEAYYSRLNERFPIGRLNVSEMSCMFQTSSDLLLKSKSLVQGTVQESEHDTSFLLFLRLVAIHLKDKGGKSQEFRQLKGRIYSKFHSRRLSELSEVGLQNLTILFLVLAEVTNMHEMTHKLCELYSTLSSGMLTAQRRAAVWRGIYALMQLHCCNGSDISDMSKKMALSFDTVCKDIFASVKSCDKYRELWKLVSLYIESLQDLVDMSSDLNLGQHKLISEGFALILPVCREIDRQTILLFVESVLTRVRIIYQECTVSQHEFPANKISAIRKFTDNMWKSFFGFVKEHSTTDTPHTTISDVAAGFTLIASFLPPSIDTLLKEDVVKCFSYFAWSEQVNPTISAKFICHLLPNQLVIDQLSGEFPEYQKHLIRAWIRLSLFISPDNTLCAELSRVIYRLNTVRDIMAAASVPESTGTVLSFIYAIGKKFNSISHFKERQEFRTEATGYFGDVVASISLLMKVNSPAETWTNIYTVCGHLVGYCSKIVYVKYQTPCLLQLLLDKMVLARSWLHSEKENPIQTLAISMLKEHLFLFLKGFSSLDYRNDPYIQRKLKEIVNFYMSKYPVRSTSLNVSTKHPILQALYSSCASTEVKQEDIDFRYHVLKIVSEDIANVKAGFNSSESQILIFIIELQKQTRMSDTLAGDGLVLLRPCLHVMLNSEKPHIKEILRVSLEACAKHSTGITQLSAIVQNFIMDHVPIDKKIFVVLEFISELHPGIIVPLIDELSVVVKNSERKRGVGVDKQLRLAFCNVLEHLGDRGLDVKSKLLGN